MKTNNQKSVLITGTSTGIGYEATKACIARGYQVFGSVRKEEDAKRLTDQFGERYRPLIFDVTDHAAVTEEIRKVQEELTEVGLHALINNSGIAIGGPILYQDMSDIEKHFHVNVFGLIKVTKACLPMLGAQEDYAGTPGKIINISSVAGKIAAPFVTTYASSKHAVEGFSHGLRRELLPFGVQVVIVGPGAVKTPIWDKGMNFNNFESTPYAEILRKFGEGAKESADKGLDAEYLGARIADIVDAKKPKLRYAFVPQRFKNWSVPLRMPDRWLDSALAKRLKLK